MNRRNLPSADRIAKPANQLGSRAGHLLDGRGQQVIAVQLVEEGAAHLLPVDQTVLDEAVENVLNAGVGAPRPTSQLTPAARLGGARQHDEHVGVDA